MGETNEAKLVPVSVAVNAVPTVSVVGLSNVIVGVGLMVKVRLLEILPTALIATEMGTVPAFTSRPALEVGERVAVTWLVLTNVVVRSVGVEQPAGHQVI
jgi:hypothetical protein